MRVTQNLFSDALVSRLSSLTSRQYTLQNQVSSGLRVQAASDDPTAMQNVLNYQANMAANDQYASNISTLQTRATSVYGVLQQLQNVSTNVSVISTSAGDASLTDLDNYAAKVSTAIEEALVQVNLKDSATGQYYFGGTASNQPPFVATRDAQGKVTAVTYQGNTLNNQVEITSDSTLSLDVPGANTTGSGTQGLVTDSRSGADFFNHLISLRDHLLAKDKASITSTDVPGLKIDENHILSQVSNNGTLQSRLESAAIFAGNNTTALTQMISKASDAEMVSTVVQLNQAQTSYQAALQSGAKIMQISLLNYIQ